MSSALDKVWYGTEQLSPGLLRRYMTLGLGTHLVLSQQTARVDRADRRDLSLFQIGWRWLQRLVALDRLPEFKMVFASRFTLPKPGFRPAT